MKKNQILLDMEDYEKIKHKPERLTEQEKLARLYAKAKELNVKIGDKHGEQK